MEFLKEREELTKADSSRATIFHLLSNKQSTDDLFMSEQPACKNGEKTTQAWKL